MKAVRMLWARLEPTTKLTVGCAALYMFLYVFLDVLEMVFGLAM